MLLMYMVGQILVNTPHTLYYPCERADMNVPSAFGGSGLEASQAASLIWVPPPHHRSVRLMLLMYMVGQVTNTPHTLYFPCKKLIHMCHRHLVGACSRLGQAVSPIWELPPHRRSVNFMCLMCSSWIRAHFTSAKIKCKHTK